MKKLQPTTQYKKDYKKYRNNPKKVEALKEVLKMLLNEQPIPAEYKPQANYSTLYPFTMIGGQAGSFFILPFTALRA